METETNTSDFLNAINTIPLPKPSDEPNRLQPQDVFEIVNELVTRYLSQTTESSFARYALSSLAVDCEYDPRKLSRIAWNLYDTLRTFSGSGVVQIFTRFLNGTSEKHTMKFYVHIYHLLAFRLLPKAEAGPVPVELDRRIELTKIAELDRKELFRPSHIFPAQDLTMIIKDLMHLLSKDENSMTTVESFICAMMQLYEAKRKIYLKSLEEVGREGLPKAERNQELPIKKNSVGYSFYTYKGITKSRVRSPKRKESKEKSPPANGKIRTPLFPKKSGKKRAPQSPEKYVAVAQGSFGKLAKENEIIEKLQEKIMELSKVVKSIDEVKAGLMGKIEEVENENEVLEQENKKLKKMIMEYMKDPRKYNLKIFKDIIAKDDARIKEETKRKSEKKEIIPKRTQVRRRKRFISKSVSELRLALDNTEVHKRISSDNVAFSEKV